MSQNLAALLVSAATRKVAANQVDLADDFNFTGALKIDDANVATTSDASAAAQDEANLRTAAAALSTSLAVNSQKITGLASGTSASDAVNRGQLDSVAAGLDVKPSVKAASTANVASLSGTTTIDGVSLGANDRVLLKNQSTASQNGIYVVAAGAWARASDLAASSDAAGAFTFVEGGGSSNGGKGFVCTSDSGSAIVGTDALVFTQFSGGAAYTAGDGVTIVDGVIGGVVDPAGPLTLSASGFNIDPATASAKGAMSPDQYSQVAALGDGALRDQLSTTDATPVSIALPNMGTNRRRRVALWYLVHNTSDETKTLYREIVFIVRRGGSGNSVALTDVMTGEIADANGSADPSGMGAISLVYTPGTNGVGEALTFTGLASTNLSVDYGAQLSEI